jgi:mannose-6-phosphate isomerase-like protein (cupin superfamily)
VIESLRAGNRFRVILNKSGWARRRELDFPASLDSDLKGGTPVRVPFAQGKVFVAAVLSIAAGAVISVAAGVPAAVHYISHEKVTEVMSKGGPIVSDPGLVVLAQRRQAGEVEYHDHTNHVFVMVEGEATLVVGGTMLDAKRTAPDQMRAPSLEGGTTYHMSKGDVITIPAKTPHWFKEVPTKTVAYYAVNIESQ